MTLTAGVGYSDVELVELLRKGDEAAFGWLIDTYGGSLKRLALAFVAGDAMAEDVVQETWLAVLTGIARFEGRSAVKTWLFQILANRAKTHAVRERRTIPFSDLEIGGAGAEPAVKVGRFLSLDHPDFPGHWASPGHRWAEMAEDPVIGRETMAVLRRGLEGLPRAQRVVVELRDVKGWTTAEVCAALELSEANQRVLLHRGRSRLRAVLEVYFADA